MKLTIAILALAFPAASARGSAAVCDTDIQCIVGQGNPGQGLPGCLYTNEKSNNGIGNDCVCIPSNADPVGLVQCVPDLGHQRYLHADKDSARRYLDDLNDKATIERMMANHPVPVDVTGTYHEKADLLSAKECNLLINYLSASSTPSNDKQSDSFQVYDRILSTDELVDIVGKQKAEELVRFLYETADKDYNAIVRKIWLREVKNDGSVGDYVDLHTDHDHAKYKQSTMVVALNSEDDIEGGEVFYLNQDGAVSVERAQGQAYAHKYDVLHGVAHHAGSRVSLLIHLDHDPSPEMEDLGADLLGAHKRRLRAA